MMSVRAAGVVWLVLAVGCVDDPSPSEDLAIADLAEADLAAGQPDLAVPADLANADLIVVPEVVETNDGLDSGKFVSVAALASGRIYAASAYRVYRSDNGGAIWNELHPPRAGVATWTAIAASRSAPGRLLLADQTGRVLLSGDGGASFTVVAGTGTLPQPTAPILALAYVTDTLFIALATEHLYRWDGTAWKDQTSNATTNSIFYGLSLDNDDPPVPYIATINQVLYYLHSEDFWLPSRASGVRSVSVHGSGADGYIGWIDLATAEVQGLPPHDTIKHCERPEPTPGYAFYGFGMQVLSSKLFVTDGGYVAYRNRDCTLDWSVDSLSPLDDDGKATQTIVTSAQTEDHQTIYLGTSHGVVQSSAIGTASAWIDRTAGLHAADVGNIASQPGQPDRLFAATERGLYVSLDGGATWNVAPGEQTLPHQPLRQVEASANRLIARTANNRVVYSDDGTHWSLLVDGAFDATYAIAIDRQISDRIYRCTAMGIDRFVPGTSTWTRASDVIDQGPMSCKALYVHPTDSSYVYVVDAANALWRSKDSAHSFETDGGDRGFSAWAFDARDPKRVLLAGDSVLYDLTDGVVSTTSKPQNPTVQAIGALAIEPAANSKTIYLATTDGRLYRSIDGATFSPFGRGLPPTPIQWLFMDGAAPTVLRLSPQHLGVWRSAP